MTSTDALFDMPIPLPSSLGDRFGIPPLTVFDRRQGYWQDRRRRWLEAGIDSGDGRDRALTYAKGQGADEVSQKLLAMSDGTSVFDPVLTETMVRWYAPAGGMIYDPFAGGSVRGIVSMSLGRHYRGGDIREEQLVVNDNQRDTFVRRFGDSGGSAEWMIHDAATESPVTDVDMILTCPPYGDLEVYSDLPEDVSNMDYDDFADAYADAILWAVDALAPNRFSIWVVGNYRDSRTGHMRNLVGLTHDAHIRAGAHYHSECVIVDPVGTGAMRAAATFKALRRPIRTHQQCLIFVKGDVRRATDALEPFTEDQIEDMMTP